MASASAQKKALLTVGSTQFDELVKSALEPTTLAALASLGVSSFIVQYGKGHLPHILRYVALEPDAGSPSMRATDTRKPAIVHTGEGIVLAMHAFMDDIEERMAECDIVISHAGAGSILAALRGPALSPLQASSNPKQLVIVPNDTLMDSHQSELALEMGKHGWARVAYPDTLAKTLQNMKSRREANNTPFPAQEPSRIQMIVEQQLGYA